MVRQKLFRHLSRVLERLRQVAGQAHTTVLAHLPLLLGRFPRSPRGRQTAHVSRTGGKISDASDQPKLWWKLVNSVIEDSYRPPIPSLLQDGKSLVSDLDKADALNSYFSAQTCVTCPPGHLSR